MNKQDLFMMSSDREYVQHELVCSLDRYQYAIVLVI